MFKVPKKTSVWKTNEGSPPGVMKFAPELVELIKQGKKYKTYRIVDDKYISLKVGDTVLIKQNLVDEPIASALITGKTKVLFKDLPIDAVGHEVYESKEHQREVLSGYLAFLERRIQNDDEFFIIDFKLL